MKDALTIQWALLDKHFKHHAELINRFRGADGTAVVLMWKSQTNEDGNRLSQFEREALVERHCELFGIWPE